MFKYGGRPLKIFSFKIIIGDSDINVNFNVICWIYLFLIQILFAYLSWLTISLYFYSCISYVLMK